MSDKLESNWQEIRATLDDAVSIAWDTCHKIYILMDEDQHREMLSYGYDPLLRVDDIGGPAAALVYLRDWYDQSCGLRFVNAVSTVPGNPNDGFETLIGQFDDYDEDDDE